ncbi:LAMI_0B07206g1_1 [Lachancea mirantina]|uniref:LAMI_0B07206g1_1 n=1 Tax=Lachancea mirantina TaxID=1230905 RepID=A0A1G4IX26_9SACH|nr:LAMI_0B07206g1_1 [Lachancea mirantina]
MFTIAEETENFKKVISTGFPDGGGAVLRSLKSELQNVRKGRRITGECLTDIIGAAKSSGTDQYWSVTNGVIRMNQVLGHAGVKVDEFWPQIMNEQLPKNRKFDSQTLDTLLGIILASEGPDTWQPTAFLLRVLKHESDAKLPLLSLLRAKYGLQLGALLTRTHTFHLACLLVEIIAIFAAPSPSTSDAAMPRLWAETSQNEAFFSNPELPLESRRGEILVARFVQRHLGPFSALSAPSLVKFVDFESKTRTLGTKNGCFVQVCGPYMYISSNSGHTWQVKLNATTIAKAKGSANDIEINFKTSFDRAVAAYLKPNTPAHFYDTKQITLRFEGPDKCDSCLKNLQLRRVSEVRTFISLNFSSSNDMPPGDSKTSSDQQEPPSSAVGDSRKISNNREESSMKTSETTSNSASHDGNPVCFDYMPTLANRHGYLTSEESPLVTAQKRKLLRGVSNLDPTNELTALSWEAPSGTNDTTTSVSSVEKFKIPRSAPNKHGAPPYRSTDADAPSTLIGKGDITSLNAIFGKQVQARAHTKLPRRSEDKPTKISKIKSRRRLEATPFASNIPTLQKRCKRETTPSTAGVTALPNNDVSFANATASTNLDCTTLTAVPQPQINYKNPSFTGNPITNKLQEDISKSILDFSKDMANKITIINEELNGKICHDLSDKYQTLFDQLQDSFQNDIAQMSQFVGEIRQLLHLSEDQLIQVIRQKQFL